MRRQEHVRVSGKYRNPVARNHPQCPQRSRELQRPSEKCGVGELEIALHDGDAIPKHVRRTPQESRGRKGLVIETGLHRSSSNRARRLYSAGPRLTMPAPGPAQIIVGGASVSTAISAVVDSIVAVAGSAKRIDMAHPANPGAQLVAPVHAFDTAALADYFREKVGDPARNLVVHQFQGGQSNPTYRVTTAERVYVLRRKPPGVLLPSAHAVDREYRVMSALAATAVPVPKTYALCEDDAIIGTAFCVMEHIEGRVLWDPTLPGLAPEERAAHYDELNRVLAALHQVDYAAIGLESFGKPGPYISRQVARWSKQYAAGSARAIPAMDRLIEWLPQHIPPGDETSIVHGDFRIDNVIFHPTEPRILAVLDWELATLGHPLSDLAYQAMAWRLSPQEFRGLKGHDLRALGIPGEADYVAAYCRRTGRNGIGDWEFYLIFNMFRIAAILHGVLSRALQGNAANQNAIETGGRARLVADVAWGMAQGEV